jgi:hypothetical protein
MNMTTEALVIFSSSGLPIINPAAYFPFDKDKKKPSGPNE